MEEGSERQRGLEEDPERGEGPMSGCGAIEEKDRADMSRRGICSDIYQDNATNFVGSRNVLKDLYEFLSRERESVSNTLINEKVSWHFIPSKSPQFGGLCEARVKKTKYHIKRLLGNTKFRYEDFYIALLQIETCINSRPLSPLSNDPDDLTPLTPGHFLMEIS
ncbi:hypothetical protein Trydic_g16745 [Trypoxylus dichotomus]